MKNVYVLRQGEDFTLPKDLCWPVTSFGPSAPGMDQYFQFIDDPASADYLFFPYYLTPMVQQKGFFAIRDLLNSLLPDFTANERKYLFFNYEDISVPFGIESRIFQISLNRWDHDAGAICYPYPVEDPLIDESLEFDQIRYQTAFVGFVGSHPLRPRLIDALSAVTDLQLYVKTNALFHGHFDEAERKSLQESYHSILRQSLTVLCPRGAAENTVRFFETMAFGRIPVLIADDAVLPCESLIDYDEFVIRVPEAAVGAVAEHIKTWLAGKTAEQLRYHCMQARKAWESWLRPERLPALVEYELAQRCIQRTGGGNDMHPADLPDGASVQDGLATRESLQLIRQKQLVCSASAADPVDIILLTYNRLDYFQQTIRALVHNTRYPYRLIIVDNHSGTELRQFLQEYVGLFDQVILNEENYHTTAFQRGIVLAQSDPYIVSDPDILVPALEGPCWLERLVTLHSAHPEMGLIALNLDSTNKPAKLPDVYIGEKTVFNPDITLGNVGTVMQSIKRRFFDGRYLTDWETCTQIRENGGKVGFASGIVGWHLGWDEDRDYPEYLVEKYSYFKQKYGAETYRMYTDKKELLSRMNPAPTQSGYYACSRPEIQCLVNTGSKRILDVGCASGRLGYELKQKLGAEVWGVEYAAAAAGEAKSHLDRVLAGTIEEVLPHLPDGYFDTIVCADVLEHLADPWQVLSDLRRKLAPDGEVVASIPNVRYWPVVKSLLEGSWRYEEAGILDRTHLRFFTRTECLQLFDATGYEIVRSEAIVLQGDAPVPPDIVGALRKAGLAVETLAEEGLHYQYAFVAKPTGNSSPDSIAHAALKPDLTSIVMLTWNQLPFTQACLTSIAAHTPEPYELIVVDNGSSDGTLEWLRKQAAADCRVTLIENAANRGFAAGCNQGITAARGEYILLLNNDTVVTPGWLSGLRETLERFADAGIVGPMTNSASGVQVVADVGYGTLAELPGWSAIYHENNRYRIIPQRRIVGFCMLLRRNLMEQIGLLDETFGPGNYEDDDYCLRAELAGFRNLVAGDVFVHHEGGATFAGNRLDRGGENRKNRTLFKQKWDPSRLDQSVLRKWLVLNSIEEAKNQSLRREVDVAVQTLLNGGIRSDSSSPLAYIELAEILMANGRHVDALQVLPEMPPAIDPLLKREIEAICHAALGNDAAARRSANQAGGRPRALVVLGTLAVRGGDLAGAEALFRQATALAPSCSSGWLSLGMLLWSQGQQEGAYQAVRRAVTVDSLNDEAVRILREMAGRFDWQSDALQAIAAGAQLYPSSRNLARNHAELLEECGQAARALEACEEYLVRFGVDEELLSLALELRQRVGVYDRLIGADGQSVSLCMIARNEEQHLAHCLASAKPVTHEMIVVDTGSSDRTRALATVFGARLFEFPWNGNFSDARNHAIAQARGAWILVLDADEVLSDRDHAAIRDAVQTPGETMNAWSVLTRNYTSRLNTQGWTANDGSYPNEEKAAGWYPSWKVRLFPNRPEIRFSGEVHEMVEASLRSSGCGIRKASFVVHHYGELSSQGPDPAKQRRYFELGKQKLEADPGNAAALIELAVQAGEIGNFEEAVDLWDRLLTLRSDVPEALFNKGYALMGLGRYAEAMAVSKRALELEPSHKEAAFNYATCELYAGEPQRALALIGPLADRTPGYPLLQAIMTVLLLADGQHVQASLRIGELQRMEYAIRRYIAERVERLKELGLSGRAELISQAMDSLFRDEPGISV